MYKRGEPWPLEVFPYEQILSFGAPLANAYKITVEGRELLFETLMVRSDDPSYVKHLFIIVFSVCSVVESTQT